MPYNPISISIKDKKNKGLFVVSAIFLNKKAPIENPSKNAAKIVEVE